MDPFVVEVIHRFEARDTSQLTVEKGELLTVLEKDSSGWWIGRNSHGKCGVFPSTYVQRVTIDPPSADVVKEVIRERVLHEVGLKFIGHNDQAAVLKDVEVDVDDLFAFDDRELEDELRFTQQTVQTLEDEGKVLLTDVLRKLNTQDREEATAQARQQLLITQRRLADLSRDVVTAQDEHDALMSTLEDSNTAVPPCLTEKRPGTGVSPAMTPRVSNLSPKYAGPPSFGPTPALGSSANLTVPGVSNGNGGGSARSPSTQSVPSTVGVNDGLPPIDESDERVAAWTGKVSGDLRAAVHIARLEKQLNMMNDQLDDLEKQLADGASAVKKKEQIYGELVENEAAATQDDHKHGGGAEGAIATAKEEAAACEARLAELQGEVADLEKRKAKLEKKLADAQAEYQTKCDEFDAEQTACEAKASEFNESKKRIVATLEKVTQIEAQKDGVLAENERLLVEATSGKSDAMRRYKEIERQRRVVYNELQELKGNLRVYCRLRPRGTGNDAQVSVKDDMTLSVYDAEQEVSNDFEFDYVFGESTTQEQIFQEVQPLATSILDGYNVCVFAYGQTGSGKTHTMEGPATDRGLNFRTLRELFLIAQERKAEYQYEFRVSVLEVYNDKVFDLFSDRKPCVVRWGGKENGVVIQPQKQVPASGVDQVLELLADAYSRRRVAGTDCNTHSSRSHCLLTIYVEGVNQASKTKVNGKLHLIDLAGSERVKQSGVEGDRLKEAAHINKSLTHLKSVIQSLANKSDHVPFRNSQLTALLQDSLGGNCKCLMFANVSVLPKNVPETVCTIKYASEARKVEVGKVTASVKKT